MLIKDVKWHQHGFLSEDFAWSKTWRALYGSNGFYVIAEGIAARHYKGWYFKNGHADMDQIDREGRVFFGMTETLDQMKARCGEHMILLRLGQFLPEELEAAERDYLKNFAKKT